MKNYNFNSGLETGLPDQRDVKSVDCVAIMFVVRNVRLPKRSFSTRNSLGPGHITRGQDSLSRAQIEELCHDDVSC